VECNVGRAWLDARTAFSHHCFCAVNRDGDAGRAGFHCEIERTLFERQETAIRRARSFNKSGDMQTLLQNELGCANTCDRAFRAAIAIDWNEIAQFHSIAEDWDAHEGALEKGRSAAGDAWNERGGIEIGDVVGHEDARGVLRHIFYAARDDANSSKAKADADDGLRSAIERGRVAGNHRPGDEDER
jgi:hypothetical protein